MLWDKWCKSKRPSMTTFEWDFMHPGSVLEKKNSRTVAQHWRGGMKVAARSGERLRREIGRGRLPRVGDG